MDNLSTKMHPRMHTDTNLYLTSRGISNSLKPIQMTWVHVTKTEAMKLKNFCTAKEIINRVKRQPMEGRKYLHIIYVNKWSMSKAYEGLPLQQQKYKQSKWECEMAQPLWKPVWRFLKNLKNRYRHTHALRSIINNRSGSNFNVQGQMKGWGKCSR